MPSAAISHNGGQRDSKMQVSQISVKRISLWDNTKLFITLSSYLQSRVHKYIYQREWPFKLLVNIWNASLTGSRIVTRTSLISKSTTKKIKRHHVTLNTRKSYIILMLSNEHDENIFQHHQFNFTDLRSVQGRCI